MAKPSTAPAPKSASSPAPEPYAAPPVKRIRAIRTGHNEYRLVEETWAGPPTSVKPMGEKLDYTGAQYRVRVWHEESLGPNRHGDSGL